MRRESNSPSYLQRLLDRLKRLFRRKPEPEPEDPYAYRAVPVRRPPHGRSGTAVAELDDDSKSNARYTYPPEI